MGDLKSELKSMLALKTLEPARDAPKLTKIARKRVPRDEPTPSSMSNLAIIVPATTLAPPRDDVERVKELVDAAKSANTLRAYAADWRVFAKWCAENNACALPADDATIALYLLYLFERRHPRTRVPTATKTIERALAGIAFKHRTEGFNWEMSRLVKEELAGIRKKRAEAGFHLKQKTPLTKLTLLEIMHALGDDLRAARDRAILLILWIGAFRRSEVANLDVSDVKFAPREGIIVRPKTSKTDQEGKNEGKALPLMTDLDACPVHALRNWLDRSGIERGPLFRRILDDGTVGEARLSDRSIAAVVKRAVKLVKLNPDEYGGHSARAGFMTSAAEDGKDISEIMSQSGHKSVAVARGYIRHGTRFTKNAAKGMF
jgi:integrase